MRHLALTPLLLLAACLTIAVPNKDDSAAINRVLDDWHKAASEPDEARYFGHMAADAVFMGTDATERWDMAAFRAYAHPHFSAGRGWTFIPRSRNVRVEGNLAWFDEVLDNAKYGESRGTGVLRRTTDGWKIVHYNLTFPIPNEITLDVVKMIQSRK